MTTPLRWPRGIQGISASTGYPNRSVACSLPRIFVSTRSKRSAIAAPASSPIAAAIDEAHDRRVGRAEAGRLHLLRERLVG